MNEQIAQLIENYKDGVPVKVERHTIISLALTELLVIALGAVIVRIVKKL
jgi:hypothetical protein